MMEEAQQYVPEGADGQSVPANGESGGQSLTEPETAQVAPELPRSAAYDAGDTFGRLTAAREALQQLPSASIESGAARLQLQMAETALQHTSATPLVKNAALSALRSIAAGMDRLASVAQSRAEANKAKIGEATEQVKEGSKLTAEAEQSAGAEQIAQQAAAALTEGLTQVAVARTEAQQKEDVKKEKQGKKLVDKATAEALVARSRAESHAKWADTWTNIADNLREAANNLRDRYDSETQNRAYAVADERTTALRNRWEAADNLAANRQDFATLMSKQAESDANATSTTMANTADRATRADLGAQHKDRLLSRLFRRG